MIILSRTVPSITLLPLFALSLLACAANAPRDDSNRGDDPTDTNANDAGSFTDDGGTGEIIGCSGVDILFVIDNSSSMLEEQANLRSNFPDFVTILDDYHASGNAPLGYRVAVTTTSVNRRFQEVDPDWGNTSIIVEDGDDGVMRGPKCGLSARWTEGPAVGVVDAFECIAAVGADGSGWEMPLAALELALGEQSSPGMPNAGFFRKELETLLVVVFITDEDDCSVEQNGRVWTESITTGISRCIPGNSQGMAPPSATKDFLDTLTGGEGHYVIATIAGPAECQNRPTHQCVSEFGEAIWASRLEELSDECGEYGVFGNIGTGDLGASLRDALEVVTQACDDYRPI